MTGTRVMGASSWSGMASMRRPGGLEAAMVAAASRMTIPSANHATRAQLRHFCDHAERRENWNSRHRRRVYDRLPISRGETHARTSQGFIALARPGGLRPRGPHRTAAAGKDRDRAAAAGGAQHDRDLPERRDRLLIMQIGR